MKKETNYEKMIAGKLYLSFDDELGKINRKARDLLDQIDKTSHSDFETRNQLVKKLFCILLITQLMRQLEILV